MRKRAVIGLLAAYYCAAMLTGAYWYQHQRTPQEPFPGAVAAYVGIVWPLYWSARAAMKITE